MRGVTGCLAAQGASIEGEGSLGLMAAAAGHPTGPFTFIDANDFKGYLLQSQLLTDLLNQFEGSGIRLVDAAQLNLDRFASQIGKSLGQFPIQNERDIGIELFLKLEQLPIFT